MKIEANSVKEYLENVPEERKAVIKKLWTTVTKNAPKGFQETLGYGMLALVVPLKTYPEGYHCNPELPLPFVNVASQKNFIALYHSGIYANPEIMQWFVEEYPKHCKYKLDMGKSCVRFKKIEDIPYDLIAELMQKVSPADWIKIYDANKPKKK